MVELGHWVSVTAILALQDVCTKLVSFVNRCIGKTQTFLSGYFRLMLFLELSLKQY